jgi:Phage integrase family
MRQQRITGTSGNGPARTTSRFHRRRWRYWRIRSAAGFDERGGLASDSGHSILFSGGNPPRERFDITLWATSAAPRAPRSGCALSSMRRLDATPKRSTIILTNSDGAPWTSDGFRTSWGKACKRVGVVGLTFHDLRGTAVTRLAIAGCTEAEIATITGHSLRDVRSILDAHYLHRDPALAESAIRKLEGLKGEQSLPTDRPTGLSESRYVPAKPLK